MNVLGCYSFDILEQRKLIEGASLDLPREKMLPKILQRIRIGDVIWVKEPWFLFTSRQFGPQNIREAVPGSIPQGLKYPPRIARIHHLLRMRSMGALTLAREDSRATLEIMGISEHSVRVLVHMTQVDDFLKSRAA